MGLRAAGTPALPFWRKDSIELTALPLQADGSDHEVKLTTHKPDKDTIQITGTAVDAETGLPLDGFKVMVGELDPDGRIPLLWHCRARREIQLIASRLIKPPVLRASNREGWLPARGVGEPLEKGRQQDVRFQIAERVRACGRGVASRR